MNFIWMSSSGIGASGGTFELYLASEHGDAVEVQRLLTGGTTPGVAVEGEAPLYATQTGSQETMAVDIDRTDYTVHL